MRKVWLAILGLGCLALIVTAALLGRNTSEEGVVKSLLADLPETSRSGDEMGWTWQRSGTERRQAVERRLAEGLQGRKGWSHNSQGWSFNPNYVRPWWSNVPVVGSRMTDRRPILWVTVLDGRSTGLGSPRSPAGSGTTVQLQAMTSSVVPVAAISVVRAPASPPSPSSTPGSP